VTFGLFVAVHRGNTLIARQEAAKVEAQSALHRLDFALASNQSYVVEVDTATKVVFGGQQAIALLGAEPTFKDFSEFAFVRTDHIQQVAKVVGEVANTGVSATVEFPTPSSLGEEK
jgi:hypothetical protein